MCDSRETISTVREVFPLAVETERSPPRYTMYYSHFTMSIDKRVENSNGICFSFLVLNNPEKALLVVRLHQNVPLIFYVDLPR